MATGISAPVHGPILLYTGIGSWGVSIDQTEELLGTYVSPLAIKRVERLDDVTSKTALVVIPGGNAPIMMILGEDGLKKNAEKLSTYLKRDGGRYLGICAGGIVASDHMFIKPEDIGEGNSSFIQGLFQQSVLIHQAPKKEAALGGLYPGGCIAPFIVEDPTIRGSLNNFIGSKVHFPAEHERFTMTHYSGPVFHQVPREAKVLLHYDAPLQHHLVEGSFDGRHQCVIYSVREKLSEPSPAACISYQLGNGKMVLSGVHPEFNPITFAACARTHTFQASLPSGVEASEPQRLRFTDAIFKELGFTTEFDK